MKPKYLIVLFLLFLLYSITACSRPSIENILPFGNESFGIALVFLLGYFLLRVKQNQNKNFRKRSISIGITCAVVSLILLSTILKNTEGPWHLFISIFWIIMAGSIIGLFISEIIQWGMLRFRKIE